MDDDGSNVRILYFNSYESLRYWFKKIYDFLCNAIPDLVWRVKVNERIDFGTQRWIFELKIREESSLRIKGYNANVIYESIEYDLEKDLSGTMTKILKGEK